MPWGDAQFWIVTALAIGGLWLVASAVRPRRSRRSRTTRTTLTVSVQKRG